jgi:hypothetical protein
VINGDTPTDADTFLFTVEVTDSSKPPQTATQALSITINAASAVGAISGEVWFNGVNITNYTSKDVVLWVRDEDTGQAVLPLTYTYDSTYGTYTISDLPSGNYGVQVYIDENTDPPDSGYFPGDFYGWNSTIQVNAGQTTQYNLTCLRIMHLTSPTDNDPPGIGWPAGIPYPFHCSPVTFQWDAVPEATRYEVKIDKYNNPPNYNFVENVFHQTDITDTNITIALSDSASDQHYLLHLYGYNGTTRVGQFMVVYTSGFGWDYRFTISLTGLVSWWPGDGNANDIKGTNDGTLNGDTTFVAGKVDQAFSFDGDGDYVEVPHDPSLNPGTSSFTVDFWVKTSVSGFQIFFDKNGSGGEIRFDTGQDGSSAVRCVLGDGDGHNIATDFGGIVNDGQFHHIAVSVDRGTEQATFYFDGQGFTRSIAGLISIDPVGPLFLGKGSTTWYMTGELDEIRFYNRNLTESEIQFIFNNPDSPCKAGPTAPTIDGVFGPSEWNDAPYQLDFDANLPANEGGGTTPARLYVKNDQNNIYFAVRFERSQPAPDNDLRLDFDNDNDGAQEAGDDAILYKHVPPNPVTGFYDQYWYSANQGQSDTLDGGTNDGEGAFGNDGTYCYYEISHPLNTTDDNHDFSLMPGDKIGVSVELRIIINYPYSVAPGDFGITHYPPTSYLEIEIR